MKNIYLATVTDRNDVTYRITNNMIEYVHNSIPYYPGMELLEDTGMISEGQPQSRVISFAIARSIISERLMPYMTLYHVNRDATVSNYLVSFESVSYESDRTVITVSVGLSNYNESILYHDPYGNHIPTYIGESSEYYPAHYQDYTGSKLVNICIDYDTSGNSTALDVLVSGIGYSWIENVITPYIPDGAPLAGVAYRLVQALFTPNLNNQMVFTAKVQGWTLKTFAYGLGAWLDPYGISVIQPQSVSDHYLRLLLDYDYYVRPYQRQIAEPEPLSDTLDSIGFVNYHITTDGELELTTRNVIEARDAADIVQFYAAGNERFEDITENITTSMDALDKDGNVLVSYQPIFTGTPEVSKKMFIPFFSESALHAFCVIKELVTVNTFPRRIVTVNVHTDWVRCNDIKVGKYFRTLNGSWRYFKVIYLSVEEASTTCKLEEYTDVINGVDTYCHLFLKFLPGNTDTDIFNTAPLYNCQLNRNTLNSGSLVQWQTADTYKSLVFGAGMNLTVVNDSIQSDIYDVFSKENATIYMRLKFTGTLTNTNRIFMITNADNSSYLLFTRTYSGGTNSVSMSGRINGTTVFTATVSSLSNDTYYNLVFVKTGSKWGAYSGLDTTKTVTQRSHREYDTSAANMTVSNVYMGAGTTATYLYATIKNFYYSSSNSFGAAPVSGLTDTFTIPSNDMFTLWQGAD